GEGGDRILEAAGWIDHRHGQRWVRDRAGDAGAAKWRDVAWRSALAQGPRVAAAPPGPGRSVDGDVSQQAARPQVRARKVHERCGNGDGGAVADVRPLIRAPTRRSSGYGA